MEGRVRRWIDEAHDISYAACLVETVDAAKESRPSQWVEGIFSPVC
jgi:hypothetical protein